MSTKVSTNVGSQTSSSQVQTSTFEKIMDAQKVVWKDSTRPQEPTKSS